MKRFFLMMMAMIAIVTSTHAQTTKGKTNKVQTVYIDTNKSAVAYHKDKTCTYLAKSKEVKSISLTEAKMKKRHACTRCYPETAKKKATTTTKKTTNKNLPARDEKGRFVKKTK